MINSRAARLFRDTIMKAHKYAAVFSRSVFNQIEHWARIGRIEEENPDLPYNFIKDILIFMKEMKNLSYMNLDRQCKLYNFPHLKKL
jgi:hypothetical protein